MYDMASLAERVGAGSTAAVSMFMNFGIGRLLESPEWQFVTQMVGISLSIVTIVWMIWQMTRKRKSKT